MRVWRVRQLLTWTGWWNITTEVGMVMFCAVEDVDRVTGEIIDAIDNTEVRP